MSIRKSTVGLMSVFLITCVLMSISSALVYHPNGTYAIKGTIYVSQCPPDQMMKMPCLLKPVPGCSVTVYYNKYIYYGDPNYPKDMPLVDGKIVDPVIKDTLALVYPPVSQQHISKGVTDANGQFGIKFDTLLQKGSALTFVYGNQKNLYYVTGSDIDTVSLYLQDQPQQPTEPELQTGYASLVGFVSGPDNVGVANAKVIIYRDKIVLDATVDPVKKDLLVSEAGMTGSNYSAVTDAKGWFSINKILIASSPSSTLPPNCFYIEAFSGNQKAISKVDLKINSTDTVRLQLSGGTPEPIVNGISSLEGYVYCGTGLLASDQKLLNTVPGCTLVVTSEITPSLNVYKMDVPATFQGFYIAITDSNGHFKIDNIKIWAEGAPFIVMAQKDGRFATSNVCLYTQKTIQCNVVLGNIENNTVVDSVATPEMKFYNDNKQSIAAAVKKSSQSTAKLFSGNFVSMTSGKLTVNLKEAQRLTIAVYSLDGKLINTICRDRNMVSGNHSFDMNAMRGLTAKMILKVTGEQFRGSMLLNPVVH